jgi:hypothetical protein
VVRYRPASTCLARFYPAGVRVLLSSLAVAIQQASAI